MWRNFLSVWFFVQHGRWAFHIYARNTYLAITLVKLGLVTSLKLSPVGRGYELDGWPIANMVLKVHTLFFLFFFFFVYYVVLLLTAYWKADLALFRRLDLEKKKTKTKNKYGLVQFAWKLLFFGPYKYRAEKDFDLYIGGKTGIVRNLGFRQYKTIIMPLIPISCSSVSCCRRCLCCAKRERTRKRCSLCSVVSCWRLLLRCSRWNWSWRSRSREVSVENLPGRGFGATCCACVSSAWEIVRDSPIVNSVSRSLRSKRFRAVQEQRTRNESQRPRENGISKTVGRGRGRKEGNACGQTPGFWKPPTWPVMPEFAHRHLMLSSAVLTDQ